MKGGDIMRDSFLDSQSLIRSVERICKDKDIQNYSTELLSRISPNDYVVFQNRIRLRRKDLNYLIALTILSWYIPEELGVLLRLEISEEFLKINPLFLALLENKGLTFEFLRMTKLWHTRDFFGNILNEKLIKDIYESLELIFVYTEKPVKKPHRHRGYRDKGSLRMSHEYHNFADLTTEQIRIEEEEKISQDTLQFLIGFIT